MLSKLFVVENSSSLEGKKILKSLKWGFTKYPRTEYVALRKSGDLTADGNIVKVNTRRGKLEKSSLFQNGQE